MKDEETPTGGAEEPKIGAEQQAVVAKLKRVQDVMTEIQKEHPWLPVVFAATPAPGNFVYSRCGDDLMQIGLLETVKEFILFPMAEDITRQHEAMRAQQKRVLTPQEAIAQAGGKLVPFPGGG